MYRYVAVFVAALIIGFLGGWKTQGWRLGKEIATIQENYGKERSELRQKTLDAEQKFRAQEQQWGEKLAQTQEKRNVEIAAITRKLNGTIVGLRNRPERITPTSSEVSSAPSACAGTTGAELAKGDGEFLARYAADAAKLDAELTKCEAAYNELRK